MCNLIQFRFVHNPNPENVHHSRVWTRYETHLHNKRQDKGVKIYANRKIKKWDKNDLFAADVMVYFLHCHAFEEDQQQAKSKAADLDTSKLKTALQLNKWFKFAHFIYIIIIMQYRTPVPTWP